MTRLSKISVLSACVLTVAGCATRPDNISPTYVSDAKYDSYSCSQLQREAEGLSSAAFAAAGAQEDVATRDAVMTTVGVVLFWPALFFNSGDGAKAAELARLKGELVALQSASDRKGCGITIETV